MISGDWLRALPKAEVHVHLAAGGPPGAVVVELPKLVVISLRTMLLWDRMLLTAPFTEFEPSEG